MFDAQQLLSQYLGSQGTASGNVSDNTSNWEVSLAQRWPVV
jgi:hypothetical protein